MTDFYPSRISEHPSIMERKEPVLHGSNALDGPLKWADLQFYENNGYLLFKKMFSDDEVEVLRTELNRTMAENNSSNESHIIREPESEEIRSIFDVHNNTDFFKRLSSHERIVRVAEQLLGSRVYVNQSRINFKPGFKGKEFYWHSDFETWHVEDGMPQMRAVSCSITLTDNHEYNGPLMLIPGSHRYFVQCPSGTPDNHYKQSLKMQQFGIPDEKSIKWLLHKGGQIDTATGPAGTVLFFECNTMHGSNGNISPSPRSNVFFVFNSIHNQLHEPYSQLDPRPEFLANRRSIEPIEPISFDLAKFLHCV